ncbi:hypothetical protein LNK15_09850 [Jeotgalicoccus huakuii]|nr:hypothetical protein [Jeotgalicoccus huakuii]
MTRRRREFNRERSNKEEKKETFKFPMDLDGSNLVNDDRSVETPSNSTPDYVKRPKRESRHLDTKPSVKRPTRYTILKAREVPSAIHGLNKKTEPVDERERYLEKFKNYNSVIVDNIVKERQKKEKRKNVLKRKEQQRRLDLALEEKKRKAQKANGEVKRTGATVTKKDNDALSVLGSKQNSLKQKQQAVSAKRVGPNVSQPGVSILGQAQNSHYKEMDKSLSERINQAFDTLDVEGRVIDYTSNGIIGRYEVKLNRSFRVSNIPRLNQALKEALGLEHLRIMSSLIGASNIGLEVPLQDVSPIHFRTLFESSSLKLRKNDLKFAVGKTVDDKIFSYELSKAGHILIYGNQPNYDVHPIDNIMLSLLMNHNPHDLNTSVVAESDDYDDYLDVPHAFGSKISPSHPDALLEILTELNERNVQFRRAHVRNIQSYNNRVKYESQKSTMVVIIDDLETLINNENADVPRALVQILRQGKPLGIHVLANFKNKDNGIRYELLQLMQTKISFFDKDNGAVNTAHELTEGNDTLVVIPTSNKPNRVSIGTIDNSVRQSVFDHIKHNNR